ncbi:MAG TPA: orotidine 5'-phosphate decarboxylase / HUMPS family protein, partial [Pseudodesulfovibrio sp.]|nr:orotidine 5'-phosphate decarboxylase / HUMPS family protein [Pseudodesulfovibrio sp.]
MADLVVALDFKDAESALSMARILRGTAPWMKVGLELFTAEGPKVVFGLKNLGFKVFLDLKFFDIPNTV